MVTVCGLSQLVSLKVSDALLSVPSLTLELASGTVTVLPAAGCSTRTTVNVAVPPASVVLPLAADTITPGASEWFHDDRAATFSGLALTDVAPFDDASRTQSPFLPPVKSVEPYTLVPVTVARWFNSVCPLSPAAVLQPNR